jgi:hypothetical protein
MFYRVFKPLEARNNLLMDLDRLNFIAHNSFRIDFISKLSI